MCDRHLYNQTDVERIVLGMLQEKNVSYACDCANLETISEFVEAELWEIAEQSLPLRLNLEALSADLALPLASDVADRIADLSRYRR